MSYWNNAPDGITASHQRNNSYYSDASAIHRIHMKVEPTQLSFYVTVPSGPGYRDVFLHIPGDRLVDLSIAVQAEKIRALEAKVAELEADKAALVEGRNLLADKLYTIKQQTESYEIWSAMHEAEQRAQQRDEDEAEAAMAVRTAAEA